MARSVVRALLTTGPAREMVMGVAIGVYSRLLPSIVEVTPVYERIMRLRVKHTLGFMFVVAL